MHGEYNTLQRSQSKYCYFYGDAYNGICEDKV